MNPLEFIAIALILAAVGGAAAAGLCWHLCTLALTDWAELWSLLTFAAEVIGL